MSDVDNLVLVLDMLHRLEARVVELEAQISPMMERAGELELRLEYAEKQLLETIEEVSRLIYYLPLDKREEKVNE